MKQEARLRQTTINNKPPPKPTAKVLKPRKPRTVPPKDLDVSITVGIAGEDVSGETYDRLALFIQEKAKMGIISFERGDSHLLLHIQGMISISCSSTTTLKKDIREAIGWMDNGPLGGSICVRSLKDKGLHTIIGIIGYCLKDEKEEHFRVFTKNISENQMQEGRRMHWIHGASEFKNRLQLTPTNVLTRALQFRKYRARSPVGTTFTKCLKEMIHTGQFIPGLRWMTIPTLSPEMTIKRTEKLWRSCVAPETITISDIYEIFFGYTRVDRYYNSLQPHEMKIADARTGNLKRDPFDEIPSPLQHDEEDNDEHEEDEPEDRQQPAAEDSDRKPTPPRPNTPRVRTKADDDECEEYIDMDAYPLEDKSREEVMQELLGSGYNCLYRRTKVKKPPKPNDRDIPGRRSSMPMPTSGPIERPTQSMQT
ncbi:hypothetical protein R1sor_025036 [Riccia sorocarpa]|uniref:Replitron HUH endonuclease domain-containing protein n=1 Tax=Riccia sorocarpa TaxID=122646 RepID=A0ABD3G7F3_9MARC